MKKILIISTILILGFFTIKHFAGAEGAPSNSDLEINEVSANGNIIQEETPEPPKPEKKDRIQLLTVEDGETFSIVMKRAGIDYGTAMDVYHSAKDLYDLARVRLGRDIELIFDKDTDEFKELVYVIDSEEELRVKYLTVKEQIEEEENKIDVSEILLSATATPKKIINEDERETGWVAKIIPIEYETKVKTSKGSITSSLYQAATDAGIDTRAIIELANAFQWTMDFSMDTRVGDTFEFVHEERYLDGEYSRPGNILAAKYNNAGTIYEVYFFEENEDNIGYFDQDGNSVQKMFLKAPVAFKYISSGFSTGPRYVGGQYKRYTKSHMAIDYAAPSGTPIRAVGAGTITFAGWSSVGYGNFVKMRHNGTYSTNYAHLSKFAVRSGQKVTQGQVIGYVGNTGFSTGPHLHYEMVKNGTKINPLREVLPPGKEILEDNKERFYAEIKNYQDMMTMPSDEK